MTDPSDVVRILSPPLNAPTNPHRILGAATNINSKVIKGPKLLSSGQQTSSLVKKYLSNAPVITLATSFGPIEMHPGTIWSENRMLIIPSTERVYYTIGDRLYELDTSTFLRDEWFGALSVAAKRSNHIVMLAKVEVALLTGIFVPWYVLLGLTVAKIGLLYYNNKESFNSAIQQSPRIIELFIDLRNNNPKLFNKIMLTAGRDILVNMPSGVTAEDVAFFIGRVIKGVGGLPEVTLGALLRIVGITAAVVAGTHLPSITAHAIEAAAAENAKTLQNSLSEAGINVSEEEAKLIMQDLLRDANAVAKLRDLETGLQELIPILEKLQKNVVHYND